jgi:hypothetical protein
MTNTVDEAIAWARRHPTKDVGELDDSWAGWCAALVFWAGGFSRSFSYALDAGDAAGRLNPDWRAAPRGAIHYWGGVWINGVENGHTAIDVGNEHTLLMASSRVNNYGAGIGTIRFADYGLPAYRGWSLNWGAEQLETNGALMALTDAEQREILASVRLLKAPVRRTIDGQLKTLSQIQDNADTNTMVRQLLVMVAGLADPAAIAAAILEHVDDELDEAQAAAIAAAVSSKLTAELGAQLPGAVVDELVERARE